MRFSQLTCLGPPALPSLPAASYSFIPPWQTLLLPQCAVVLLVFLAVVRMGMVGKADTGPAGAFMMRWTQGGRLWILDNPCLLPKAVS